MTFEDLSKQLNISVQSLQNLVQVLSAAFSDMESGSDVVIEPAQESGYLVGNIIVNGEDNYLYAPPQIIPPHIYSDTERQVGVWFHDGISEDVYEITKDLSDVSGDYTNPTPIMPSTNKILSVRYSGLYTADGSQFLISSDSVILSYTTAAINFHVYTQKGTTNYAAYKSGTGTLNSLIATYRYTKQS